MPKYFDGMGNDRTNYVNGLINEKEEAITELTILHKENAEVKAKLKKAAARIKRLEE